MSEIIDLDEERAKRNKERSEQIEQALKEFDGVVFDIQTCREKGYNEEARSLACRAVDLLERLASLVLGKK